MIKKNGGVDMWKAEREEAIYLLGDFTERCYMNQVVVTALEELLVDRTEKIKQHKSGAA